MRWDEEVDELVPIVEWLAGMPEHEIPSFSLVDIDRKVRYLNALKLVVRDRKTKKPRLSKWAQDRWQKMTAREMVIHKLAWVEERKMQLRANLGGPDLTPHGFS